MCWSLVYAPGEGLLGVVRKLEELRGGEGGLSSTPDPRVTCMIRNCRGGYELNEILAPPTALRRPADAEGLAPLCGLVEYGRDALTDGVVSIYVCDAKISAYRCDDTGGLELPVGGYCCGSTGREVGGTPVLMS